MGRTGVVVDIFGAWGLDRDNIGIPFSHRLGQYTHDTVVVGESNLKLYCTAHERPLGVLRDECQVGDPVRRYYEVVRRNENTMPYHSFHTHWKPKLLM